jgi:ribosomal protein S18 acetylase RimI-like enzyme
MTVRVIRLTESDWPMFGTLRLRALSDSLGESDHQYQAEVTFTAAQWRQRLRAHTQFAVLNDGDPVGLIAAQQESPQSVYLYSLWVEPRARRAGLARELVAAAVDWAREQGVQTVTLRVAADNIAARGVYESAGFSTSTADVPGPPDEVAMVLSVS